MRLSKLLLVACTMCITCGLLTVDSENGSTNHAVLAPRDENQSMRHASNTVSSMPDEGNNADDISGDTDESSNDIMKPSPMSMSAHHGRPVLEQPDLEPQQRKYWEQYNATTFFNAEAGNKVLLYSHASLTVLAWFILYPTTVLMSTDARTQWLYVPLQSLQVLIVSLSILCLLLYVPTAPGLYPSTIYPRVSIAMFFLSAIHWTAMILKSITHYLHQESSLDGPQYVVASSQLGEHQNSPLSGETRSASYEGDEVSYCDTLHPSDPFDIDAERLITQEPFHYDSHKASQIVKRLARSPFVANITSLTQSISQIMFSLLNYPLLVLGIQYVLLGTATSFCLGLGHNVYGLLAHVIKGSVFFMLGFFELARYFGAFATYGMGWNAQHIDTLYATKRTPDLQRWTRYLKFWPEHPTMEFWQSFLIFFYGATNVFLEHLGNSDGKWTHKDLQHVSIAFMFFGGGLCGLVLESTTIHRAMSSAFGTDYQPPLVRTVSLNPMPAFIIFWTGALMSHHQQETEFSTAIHVQWGTMLCIAAVLRLLTLAMLFTRGAPADGNPQRPFSEVLVSACLVCGGLIFMSSNRETVEAEIYRGFDQMFTLNVSVGMTMLLLALFSLALGLRGWATNRGM